MAYWPEVGGLADLRRARADCSDPIGPTGPKREAPGVIGRIQCFMPALRRGVLRAETGEELAFRVPEELGELQGGDVVEFELGGNGRPFVSRVRLRHRWADVLNAEERALVNQFHQTIQIQR